MDLTCPTAAGAGPFSWAYRGSRVRNCACPTKRWLQKQMWWVCALENRNRVWEKSVLNIFCNRSFSQRADVIFLSESLMNVSYILFASNESNVDLPDRVRWNVCQVQDRLRRHYALWRWDEVRAIIACRPPRDHRLAPAHSPSYSEWKAACRWSAEVWRNKDSDVFKRVFLPRTLFNILHIAEKQVFRFKMSRLKCAISGFAWRRVLRPCRRKPKGA